MNGVTVYPHVTGGKWCADCNPPADICRGHDDNTMRAPTVDVTALAQQIAALPVQTQVELAYALVAADAPMTDRFVDMLLDVIVPDALPSERYAGVCQAQTAAISDDLRKWAALDDDIDYDYLPAMAQ